jgi:hypothetical protein
MHSGGLWLEGHDGDHEGYAILYTGDRFTGDSYRMFPGEEVARKSDMDNGIVSFRFENIRSIELRGDVVLEAWTNSNFRGQSVRLSQSSADLRNLPPSRQSWSGRIQSLRADFREDEHQASTSSPTVGRTTLPDLGPRGGVAIFSEADYQGSSHVFEKTDHIPDLNRVSRSNLRWNDRVVGVYIDGPYSVVLYENGDFNGNYVVLNESVPDLDQLRSSNGNRINWSRAVSSMEIIQKGRGVDRPNNRSKYAGTLYEDDNYKGKYFALYDGQVLHNLREWMWNDEASSVMVEEGYQIVLFKSSNFRDGSLTIDKNQPSMKRLSRGWNDAASSLKVVKVK